MKMTCDDFRPTSGCSLLSQSFPKVDSIRDPAKLQSWRNKRLGRASPTCSAVAHSSISAAASTNLPGLLLGAGLLLLGFAAIILVVVAIPTILVRPSSHASYEITTVLCGNACAQAGFNSSHRMATAGFIVGMLMGCAKVKGSVANKDTFPDFSVSMHLKRQTLLGGAESAKDG